jgi:hypothetical protein
LKTETRVTDRLRNDFETTLRLTVHVARGRYSTISCNRGGA